MYSYEERLRAVKLYIKYDHSLSAVIRELGYPSHQALLQWYREYITQGDLHAECVRHRRRCKFTMEQRKAALAYYQEHGQNLARTVKKLGYPSRATLFNWLKEDIGREQSFHFINVIQQFGLIFSSDRYDVVHDHVGNHHRCGFCHCHAGHRTRL